MVVVISIEALFSMLQEHPDAAKILERVRHFDERLQRKGGELSKLQIKLPTMQVAEVMETLDSLSDDLSRLEEERSAYIQNVLGVGVGK